LLEARRSAVWLVRRVQADPVVPPTPSAGESGDRHHFDGRDAEIDEVSEPFDDADEGCRRGEGPDVKFVDHPVG
jgi:hypothetical protein